MNIGDIVRITFGPHEKSVFGLFICNDTIAYGEDSNGDNIITRGYILWDGSIYSTPLDQVEVINESR